MTLFQLFHHKWAMPLLAAIHEEGGGRFASLVRQLGASPGGIRQTLAHLQEIGLVEKEAAYGHPLRPEFGLTKPGRRIAEKCALLRQACAPFPKLEDSKWTIAILAELGDGRRFSEIRERMPHATDRALSHALKHGLQLGVIHRQVSGGFPPTTTYSLADGTEGLMQAVLDLKACLKN